MNDAFPSRFLLTLDKTENSIVRSGHGDPSSASEMDPLNTPHGRPRSYHSCFHASHRRRLPWQHRPLISILLEDLDDASKTRQLAESDLAALRTVADWIKTFVARPHKDLGRAGPVCPFVPGALERKTLWLASEQIAGRSVPDVVQLINGYKRLFLHAQPIDGDDANYKVNRRCFHRFVGGSCKRSLRRRPEATCSSVVCGRWNPVGPFYEGNEGTAIYNSGFRPFQSPVPFLFVRHGVISDWKFFLDNEDWLNLWAHRYGESAVRALAEELRRLPWRAGGDQPTRNESGASSFALGSPASDSTRTDASACLAQATRAGSRTGRSDV